MLVLSRGPNDKIVFPTLGITVHLLRVQSRVVRVGIEAPPDVPILRHELEGADAKAPPRPAPSHELRNRLGELSLSLHQFHRQREVGHEAEADATLVGIFERLEQLERDCERLGRGRPAEPKAQPAEPARRCRTLVVDDDDNERELLAGLLSLNGCDCATASDGNEALAYLAEHERPDYVLLDMWMPRCDGSQTLRRIRSEPRYDGLKVIAVSGSEPSSLGVGIGPGGVDAWFSKPLDPRRLWEAMQQGLIPKKG